MGGKGSGSSRLASQKGGGTKKQCHRRVKTKGMFKTQGVNKPSCANRVENRGGNEKSKENQVLSWGPKNHGREIKPKSRGKRAGCGEWFDKTPANNTKKKHEREGDFERAPEPMKGTKNTKNL